MNAVLLIGLSTLLLAPAPKSKAKPKAAAPTAAKPAVAPANDPVQKALDAGELKGTFNPVLFRFLTEEAKGRLPEAQRKAAIEQLVAGFRENVKVEKSAQRTGELLALAGQVAGGDIGRAVTESASQIMNEWIESAFLLQKAGYKAEAATFFEGCIQNFFDPQLRARCTVGLAAQNPDQAFDLVLGLVNNGKAENRVSDDEVTNLGLRLLGEMAGSDALTKAQKDRALEELIQRTKGLMNSSNNVAAAQGLVASKDPRAVEPLRAMTKGMLKNADASRIATRGLFLVFGDAGATESLQKKLKGGFMSLAEEQVDAAVTLIEGGHPAGFEFAAKFLGKKRKGDDLPLALDLIRALGRKGGEESKRVLAGAVAAQKPKEELTAFMAVQLLALGDESGLEIVKAALANKKWPGIRTEAAVQLAKRGDLSGLPVLKEMMQKPSLGKALAVFAVGGSLPDADAARMRIANAFARIDHPEVVPPLVGLLDEKSEAVRTSAADALARMSDASALDGLGRAIEIDYGTFDGRSVNPEQHAYLVRSAATRFPKDERTAALLKKAAESPIATVKFLALAETRVTAR